MPTTRALAAALIAAALMLAACSSGSPLPDRAADAEGSISQIVKASRDSELGAIMVAGPNASGVVEDQAYVSATSKTKILVQTSNGFARGTFDDLLPNDKVRVWFTGPVAESYPVQATAEVIAVVQ